jgi:hypothetical protein
MMSLEFTRYKNDIHNAISKLDRSGQCKFAAWCCNAVLKDEEVRAYLSHRPSGALFLRELQAVLDDIWHGLCADRGRVENFIEATGPFLPDGVLGDISTLNGTEHSRVLGSLEVIDAFLGWALSGNASYLEECAVARLDRVGWLVELDVLDGEDALEQEASSQLQFLDKLSRGRASALQI